MATGNELIDLWTERDERYHTRPRDTRHMSTAEADMVRLVRTREMSQASEPGVITARRYLLSWEPPFQERPDAIAQAKSDSDPHPLTLVASPKTRPGAHHQTGGAGARDQREQHLQDAEGYAVRRG